MTLKTAPLPERTLWDGTLKHWVNQGRIAEVKDGSHGTPALAKAEDLPPRGPPGVKGRRLRYTVGKISEALEAGDTQKAKDLIAQGVSRYDENEA